MKNGIRINKKDLAMDVATSASLSSACFALQAAIVNKNLEGNS